MGGADGNLRRGSRNGGGTARRESEPGTAGRATYTAGAAPATVDPGREVLIHLDRARKQLAILERTLHDGDSRSAAGASWMLRTALQSARKLLDSADHDGLDVQRDELVQLTAKAEPLIDSPPTTRTSTSTSTSHATSEVRADKVHERAHSADDFLSFEEAPNSIAVETACRQDPATKDIAELVKGVPISTPPDTAEPRNELTSAALAHYLSVRSGDVWRALREYLYPTVWPKTSPRLEWNESVFNAILVGALEGGVDLSERQLRELLHPHDVLAAIAPHVAAPEAKDLPAAVKLVLGQLFRAALGPSVGRMTARYVDVADAMYAADPTSAPVVRRNQLVASAPIDRFVANALTAGIARVAPDADILTGKRKPPRAGLRPVTLTFMGATEPAMWFVVRAEPADATQEEVAASLFAYAQQHGEPTSYYAYGLASAGALHALPASWAFQFPDARRYAPKAVQHGTLPEPKADSIGARLAVMASSEAGDAVALSQAAHDANGPSLSASDLGAVFDECAIQLEHVRRGLVAWELASPIVAEIGYVVSRRNRVADLPSDQLGVWSDIALGQRERLYRIASGLQALDDTAAKTGVVDKRSRSAGPLRDIVARLANAAATSHLASTSEQLLAEAQQLQASLSLRSLQANIIALESAREGGQAIAGSDKQMRDQAHAYLETKEQAQILERKLLNGGEVSAEEMERVQLQAQELALQTRLHTTQVQLDRLVGVWMSAGQGLIPTIVGTRKFNDIGPASVYIHAALGDIYNDLNAEAKHVKPVNDQSGGTIESAQLDARRAALSRAQQRYAQLQKDRDLAHFFNDAYDAVKSQQLRTAITHAALAIGIGIASAGVAGWVADGLVAAQGVGAVAELSMGARIAITATEVMGNAVGQTITSAGEEHATSFWGALVDNAAFVLAPKMLGPAEENIHAARAFENMLAKQLATIEAQEARAAAAMKVLAKTGRVMSWTTHQAGSITAHTIMGMAMGAVVAKGHQVVNGSANAHAGGGVALTQDLVIQGASVAVGKLVHGSIGERLPGFRQLAQRRDLANAQQLLADALALHQLAAEISVHPDAKVALELLHKRSALLEAELHVLDDLATHESSHPTQGGPSAREIAEMRTDIKAQLGEVVNHAMLDVQWRLLGLHELAPGVWSGTPGQVARAIDEAKTSGHDVESTGDQAEISRRVRIDGKEVEFHAHGLSNEEVGSDPVRRWQLARAQMLRGEVPSIDLLPRTSGNDAGLNRLADIHADDTIPAAVREQFFREFGRQLRDRAQPPDDLFRILNEIVYSKEGRQRYQRRGTKIPNAAYVRDVLGGLRRLVALRALCQHGMLSPEFYERAQQRDAALPEYQELSWMNGAQRVVDMIKSGAIAFDPNKDLLPTAVIQGREAGDSGWFFAGADADVSEVSRAQSQLAIGGAYLDGYVVLDLPAELALPDPASGHVGASRPTALDLTLDPLGKLNPDKSEPTGRTNPQSPGQVAAREVVMPPVPLSSMRRRTYVPTGGAK